MVKIRLRRMGAKKNPFYRIVVADSRCLTNPKHNVIIIKNKRRTQMSLNLHLENNMYMPINRRICL